MIAFAFAEAVVDVQGQPEPLRIAPCDQWNPVFVHWVQRFASAPHVHVSTAQTLLWSVAERIEPRRADVGS